MGNRAVLRENMNKITRALCILMSVVALSGCASQGTQGVSIADFAEHSVSTAAVPEVTSEPVQQESAPQSDVSSAEITAELSDPDSSAAENQPDTAEMPEETTQQTSSTPAKPQTTASAVQAATKSSTSAAKEHTTPHSTVTTTPKTTVTTTQAAVEHTPSEFGSRSYSAVNYSEVKGIWISYIELAALLQGQSKEGFRSNIAAVYENCADLGINTVYVHVRSHSDAYYRSELFPWSKYVTGTLGKDPGYDPLEVMISEAHKRGISFHAWINPLRACGCSDISSYGSFPVYTFAKGDGMAGKYAVNVNDTYYLNPAYDEVTELIAAGAAEIVSNYDVDGLHIDDYFYPTTDASFDSAAYSASGYSSLSDFRFANCDRMVKELYSAVHSANSTAKFSVSTQGRIENNYNQLYADVRKWCTTPGYADIMIPQIYYGFENSAAPYQSTLDEWDALAKQGGIPLIAGLSVSKAGCEDTWAGSGKYEWVNNSDIISRQAATAKKCSSYGGIALYSYRSVFQPESSVSKQVKKEITALRDIL